MNWGFDIENTPAEMPTQNLTAGTYKMLIESVELGMKPQNGQYKTVSSPAEAGNDLIIQVKCLLTEESNGFKEGWKHNLFFRPLKEGTAGAIARTQFKQLLVACGCVNASNNDELVGKQFSLTLVQQKNNPEYTNIKEIKSLSEVVSADVNSNVAKEEPAVAQKPNKVPVWD